MKGRFLLYIAALSALVVSCTKDADIPMFNVTDIRIDADIDLSTKSEGSTDASDILKNSWSETDRIYLYSNGVNAYFRSNSRGKNTTFSFYDGKQTLLRDGMVFGAYPERSLSDSGHLFSLDGQTGEKERLDKVCLMTAEGMLESSVATLSFKHRIAVIDLVNVKMPLDNSYDVIRATLSGEGVSSQCRILINSDNTISVLPEGDSPVVIKRPPLQADNSVGYIEDADGNTHLYIAFCPTGSQKSVTVTFKDCLGGTFSCILTTPDKIEAGNVYTINDITLSGGYPIIFYAGVGVWTEDGCRQV